MQHPESDSPDASRRLLVLGSPYAVRPAVEALRKDSWELRVGESPDGSRVNLTWAEVLLVVEPDISLPAVQETISLASGICPTLPIIICTSSNPENLEALLGLPADAVLTFDSREFIHETLIGLGTLLDKSLTHDLLSPVVARIRRIPMDPILRRALLFACRLRVGPAAATFAEGGSTFVRFAEDLTEIFGCYPTYLSSKAGEADFPLSLFLRWVTLIRGLELAAEGGWSWTEVAIILGFPSLSAWSNFVRRLVGKAPTEAVRQPLHAWVAALLDMIDTPGSESSSGPNRRIVK